MRFKIEGKELPELDKLPLNELMEAERALNVDLETTGLAGRTALMLFVAWRRENPNKPVTLLADEVMSADFTTVETVEDDAGPPDGTAADPADPDVEHQPTTGPPPSGLLESQFISGS